jgi:hypothetical protein
MTTMEPAAACLAGPLKRVRLGEAMMADYLALKWGTLKEKAVRKRRRRNRFPKISNVGNVVRRNGPAAHGRA